MSSNSTAGGSGLSSSRPSQNRKASSRCWTVLAWPRQSQRTESQLAVPLKAIWTGGPSRWNGRVWSPASISSTVGPSRGSEYAAAPNPLAPPPNGFNSLTSLCWHASEGCAQGSSGSAAAAAVSGATVRVGVGGREAVGVGTGAGVAVGAGVGATVGRGVAAGVAVGTLATVGAEAPGVGATVGPGVAAGVAVGPLTAVGAEEPGVGAAAEVGVSV